MSEVATKRCFIAIRTEQPVLGELELLRERLVAAEPEGITWYDSAKWHVTLRFLGEVEEMRIPALAEALRKLCASGDFRPFFLHPAGMYVWRHVICLGLGGDVEILHALHRAVVDAAHPYAASPLGGFDPHLTVGRVRKSAPTRTSGRMKRLVCELHPAFAAWRVSHVELIQGGPIHQLIARFPLGG